MKKQLQRTVFYLAQAVFHILPLVMIAGNGPRHAVKDTMTCLEVSGKVNADDQKDKGSFVVKLYEGNEVIDSVSIGANKEFKFTLEKNSNYTVKICRKGYITKAVWIDTELPQGVNYQPVFRFHFETLLVKHGHVSKKNADILDFPIALVYYDEGKGWFDYSRKYTSRIKTVMDGKGTY